MFDDKGGAGGNQTPGQLPPQPPQPASEPVQMPAPLAGPADSNPTMPSQSVTPKAPLEPTDDAHQPASQRGDQVRQAEDIFDGVDGGSPAGQALGVSPSLASSTSPPLSQPASQAGPAVVQAGQAENVNQTPTSDNGVAVPQLGVEGEAQEQAQPQSPEVASMMASVEGQGLSTGKKIVIIIVSVLLVAAIAAGGYWLYERFNKPLGAQVGDYNDEDEEGLAGLDGENDDEPVEDGEEDDNQDLNNESEPEGNGTSEVEPPLDTDGDGLTDDEELVLGTNVNAVDSDRDGLSDKEEVEFYKSNPLSPDTDGDSYLDGDEVKNGYDPLGPGRLLNAP